MLELIEFLVLGVGVGTFGALLGLGGGIILVPLFMMFMLAPNGTTFSTIQQVVGTSRRIPPGRAGGRFHSMFRR